MLPHQEDSSVWSMTQNKLTGHLSSRDYQWKNGEEQKSARQTVVFKSKNPSAGRAARMKPECQSAGQGASRCIPISEPWQSPLDLEHSDVTRYLQAYVNNKQNPST